MYKAVDRDLLRNAFRKTTRPKISANSLTSFSTRGMASTQGYNSLTNSASRAGFSAPTAGRLSNTGGAKGESETTKYKEQATRLVTPRNPAGQNQQAMKPVKTPLAQTSQYGGLDPSRMPTARVRTPQISRGLTRPQVSPSSLLGTTVKTSSVIRNAAKGGWKFMKRQVTPKRVGIVGAGVLGYGGYKGYQAMARSREEQRQAMLQSQRQGLYNQTAYPGEEESALTYVPESAQRKGSFRDSWVNRRTVPVGPYQRPYNTGGTPSVVGQTNTAMIEAKNR